MSTEPLSVVPSFRCFLSLLLVILIFMKITEQWLVQEDVARAKGGESCEIFTAICHIPWIPKQRGSIHLVISLPSGLTRELNISHSNVIKKILNVSFWARLEGESSGMKNESSAVSFTLFVLITVREQGLDSGVGWLMKAEEDAGGGEQQEVGGFLWILRCFVSQRVKARPRYTETCG